MRISRIPRQMRQRLPLCAACIIAAAVGGCEDYGRENAGAENTAASAPAPHVAAEPIEADSTVGETGLAASAVVLEVSEPKQVRAGERFQYQVVATNVTDHAVDDVVVYESASGAEAQASADAGESGPREKARPNARSGDDSAPARGMAGRRAVGQAIGRLNPGESRAVTFQGIGRSEGTLQRCLTVDYRPAWCATVQVVKPNLAIAQRLTQPRGYICDDFAVHYRVTNPGSGATEPVHLRVQLPDGLVTAEGAAAADVELGPIGPGESVEKQIALAAARPGEFEIYAVAETADLQVESQRATLFIAQPEIALRADGPKQAYLNRPVNYTVSLRNTGDVAAHNAAVKIALPDGARNVVATNQAYDPAEGVVQIGSLDPGDTYQLTVSYDAADKGEMEAHFAARAYCAEEQETTLATTIRGIPAVQLEMIDMADPFAVGEMSAYEVRVKNEGSAPDLGIQLTGKLPETLEFVSGGGATDVAGDGRSINFGKLDQLAPGETAVWRLRVRGDQPGKSNFTVELTTDTNRRPVIEQEPTTIIAAAGQ